MFENVCFLDILSERDKTARKSADNEDANSKCIFNTSLSAHVVHTSIVKPLTPPLPVTTRLLKTIEIFHLYAAITYNLYCIIDTLYRHA